MALKLSTGLRDGMLDTSPFRTLLDASRLKLYSGSAPADADAAEGTLLVSIGSAHADTHCHFLAGAVSGVLSKDAHVWRAAATATGTATHFRLVVNTDTGVLSTSEIRMQGTIGTSGADLNMSAVSIVSGATQTIDTFNVTMPAS
ncbi:MAG: hypothetical protein GY774_10625 [Planctomycetes bacterium]|nr:hypothetical protein [Planctomycetota bacterium]